MDRWWVYASAGVAGMLWGAGYVQPAVAIAFVAGIWLGANNDVIKWAAVALIAGYVVGSMMIKRGQATT